MSVQIVTRQDAEAFATLAEARSGVEEGLRREIARELHDRVAQTLTLMLLDLEHFRREQYGRQSVLTSIVDMQRRTRSVINELRELMFELRSEMPGRQSVTDSVRALLAELEPRLNVRASIVVSADWPANVPSHLAQHIQRIVTEAAQNAVRHGGARHVEVVFDRDEKGQLQLRVVDDGTGMEDMASVAPGLGLVGMRERALLLGGTLSVERADRGGTIVRLTLPEHSPGRA